MFGHAGVFIAHLAHDVLIQIIGDNLGEITHFIPQVETLSNHKMYIYQACSVENQPSSNSILKFGKHGKKKNVSRKTCNYNADFKSREATLKLIPFLTAESF